MSPATREELGPFMSLVCFQYLRKGAEENAGRALVVAAGRQRGVDLIGELGLANSTHDATVLKEKLDAALGAQGTRLCHVDAVKALDDGGFEVHIHEGACAAGVHSDEPHCAFTMGVFIGAVSALTGKRMTGRETVCEAMGGPECIYMITPV